MVRGHQPRFVVRLYFHLVPLPLPNFILFADFCVANACMSASCWGAAFLHCRQAVQFARLLHIATLGSIHCLRFKSAVVNTYIMTCVLKVLIGYAGDLLTPIQHLFRPLLEVVKHFSRVIVKAGGTHLP
ncbi:hypothetical protein XEUV181_01985 [Xanthomonas euvesicatoria]|nr:hypothetical protein BHE83_20460 [Xanthomonas euvesicatoria pv. vesicatoria str. 85-10]KHL63721.1 hypothetical protein XEU66b_01695 [Xanthomonas euvesicatoria]KHL67300.1 hypothetical protein XEU83M_02105 [Xanthomonas euvesicatoria]KLA53165.1 hypothetical protein XEUV685_15705 [Xanthomonas euvesicatoria]KLA57071.1 hypothetical protein XEUV683_02315 [Xanthomonas euvesicatoria]